MKKQHTIRPYYKEDFTLWNNFIAEAKNATFLFHRNFMEYHSDRFDDFSLLIFDKEKLVSVLPANKVDDTVFSHQGLTYGGLIFKENQKLENALELFKIVLKYLLDNNITVLNIKPIPSIYCNYFSDELNYCLFITKATLYRRDCQSVIDLTKDFTISKGRKEGIKKGVKNNLKIIEDENCKAFFEQVLEPNLAQKHNAKPAHSAAELQLLKDRFPENIKLFTVYKDNAILAGTVLFISENVVHSQYISGNEQKSELGSIDFLYHYLITEKYKNHHFLDFGISNEYQGRKINAGLSFWKASFGAKTVTQDFYEVQTSNYHLLENVLI